MVATLNQDSGEGNMFKVTFFSCSDLNRLFRKLLTSDVILVMLTFLGALDGSK